MPKTIEIGGRSHTIYGLDEEINLASARRPATTIHEQHRRGNVSTQSLGEGGSRYWIANIGDEQFEISEVDYKTLQG